VDEREKRSSALQAEIDREVKKALHIQRSQIFASLGLDDPKQQQPTNQKLSVAPDDSKPIPPASDVPERKARKAKPLVTKLSKVDLAGEIATMMSSSELGLEIQQARNILTATKGDQVFTITVSMPRKD
jgi:hypothetical protein